MENKFAQAFFAGIIATAVMTGIGLILPFIGLPRMNPAEMLSGMLAASPAVGYIIHFIIGWIFAAVYVYMFNRIVKIRARFWKGLLFGLAVFIFAQVMLWLIGMIATVPPMDGSPVMIMTASLIIHLVFGILVVLIAPVKVARKSTDITFVHQH